MSTTCYYGENGKENKFVTLTPTQKLVREMIDGISKTKRKKMEAKNIGAV